MVSHGLYLMNLGAPDAEVPTGPKSKGKTRNIFRTSIESLIQHLEIGDRLGLAGVVLHVGSSKGSNYQEAVARIGEGIAAAFDAAGGETMIYLENTAGAGDTIGRTFEQLRDVFDAVDRPDRLGFCLDTQHLFASGFPIHEEGGIDRVLDDFDEIVGLKRLRCLHLNDSKNRPREQPRSPREHRRRPDWRRRFSPRPSATRPFKICPWCWRFRDLRATGPTAPTWSARGDCMRKASKSARRASCPSGPRRAAAVLRSPSARE